MQTELVIPIIGESDEALSEVYCFGNPDLMKRKKRLGLSAQAVLETALRGKDIGPAENVGITMLLHSSRKDDPFLEAWTRVLLKHADKGDLTSLRAFCPSRAENTAGRLFMFARERFALPDARIHMRSEDGFKGEEPHAEAVYWAGIDDILFQGNPTGPLRKQLRRKLLQAVEDPENFDGSLHLPVRSAEEPSW